MDTSLNPDIWPVWWRTNIVHLQYLKRFTTYLQSEERQKRTSAMSQQICPATAPNCRHDHEQLESVCHVPDARADHRCLADEDCGVDSTSCKRRSCSIAGYCGLWLSWGRALCSLSKFFCFVTRNNRRPFLGNHRLKLTSDSLTQKICREKGKQILYTTVSYVCRWLCIMILSLWERNLG